MTSIKSDDITGAENLKSQARYSKLLYTLDSGGFETYGSAPE
jgi:hypothetical protein